MVIADVTLVAVIGLLIVSVWMLKRLAKFRDQKMNFGRSIKILEKRPLSPKTSLYFIEMGDKKIIIAESQLDVRHIATFEDSQKKPD